MEEKLIENWKNLICEVERKLKSFENASDSTYEDKSVYEIWEQFLNNQKSSLENYINYLHRKNQEGT